MNIKQLAAKLGLDEEEYIELLELFITTGKSDMEKLQSAVQSKDIETAVQAAHSIKGAAGNLGLLQFYETAKKIEENARKGTLEGAAESTQELIENLVEIEVMIHG